MLRQDWLKTMKSSLFVEERPRYRRTEFSEFLPIIPGRYEIFQVSSIGELASPTPKEFLQSGGMGRMSGQQMSNGQRRF